MLIAPSLQLVAELKAQIHSEQPRALRGEILVYQEREVIGRPIVEIHDSLDLDLLDRVRLVPGKFLEICGGSLDHGGNPGDRGFASSKSGELSRSLPPRGAT